MGSSCGFGMFTYIKLVMLIILLVPYKSISALPNEHFIQVNLIGTKLVKYESHVKISSSLRCAYMCAQRRKSIPVCDAFAYHPLDWTCDFFNQKDAVILSPNLLVFLYKATDVFHEISIDDLKFSIYFASERMTYFQGRAHCQNLGGYLIEFDHMKEYDAMMMVLDEQDEDYFFVGANDIKVEGTWVTDRDGKPLDMNVWTFRNNAPNNLKGIEHCAYIIKQNNPTQIGDINCDFARGIICERDV